MLLCGYGGGEEAMVSVLDYRVNGGLTVLRRLELYGALIGKVPPKPLWAEMLWQQQGGQSGEEADVRQ